MDYIEMNREERYFCFLLGHALLTSITFREQFCKKIYLPSENLEVYPEAAWLRDYWKSLDYENGGGVGRWRLSASQKDNKREVSRKDGLTRILHIALNGADPNDIEQLLEINEDFFWSKEVSQQGEIISPGRWPIERLIHAPLREKLVRLKWAFNAKPDLMLVSGREYCLIEAKVESSEDVYKCSFCEAKQTKVQELIGDLITGLCNVRYSKARNIMLSRKEVEDDNPLSWKDVVSLVEQNRSSLDSFTVEGFERSPFLRKLDT